MEKELEIIHELSNDLVDICKEYDIPIIMSVAVENGNVQYCRSYGYSHEKESNDVMMAFVNDPVFKRAFMAKAFPRPIECDKSQIECDKLQTNEYVGIWRKD